MRFGTPLRQVLYKARKLPLHCLNGSIESHYLIRPVPSGLRHIPYS